MEAYSNAHHGAHTRTSHLTKLYSDAKKSALISLEVKSNNYATQQFSALHRKYRIQKDRLITWGLAWSDDEKGPDGNIDESVARAGLTETVDSVLRNIKEVTDEAERIKAASVSGGLSLGSDDKISKPPLPFDEARYEDLLKDLTDSIDTLYDLSRSRKALARGEHPTFSTSLPDRKVIATQDPVRPKDLFRASSYASSELTLVNPPPFSRPSLSPYAGLPPRINPSALRLPEEGPPPYESLGVPSTTRLVGSLIRSRSSELVQSAVGSSAAEVPVLVEFANFDSTYRDTGVPPPLQRLETLSSFLQPMRPESQTNLSLLGYFEDADQPRLGLVYDLPYSMQNRLQERSDRTPHQLAPISLLKLVQKATKAQTANTDPIPALEDRFRIALRLTEQLHAMHDREVAHGNINSSCVIFTSTDGQSVADRRQVLRTPLLASFDLFSKCSVEGIKQTVNLNIYKHPEDDPQTPGRGIGMDIKYDMYGLALLLLEIGLWTPISDLYKAKYSLPDFKLRLEKLWIPKLAAKCGSAYTRAVQACVAAADDLDLNSMMTVVEKAYVFILQDLHRCCFLDEVTPNDAGTPAYTPSDSTFTNSVNNVRRKPVPVERDSLSRQQSERNELLRAQSMSSDMSGLPDMLPSASDLNLAAALNTAQRETSSAVNASPIGRRSTSYYPLQRESTSQLKRSLSNRFTGTFASRPSFKEYKSKVTLIQQWWRTQYSRNRAAQSEERGIVAEPEEHTVQPRRREFPALELPQTVIDEWHSKTSYQLARLVERALKGSPESSSISLTAYGETPETARPTYLVCCSSTAKVKQVLKRHFKFDTSMCDLRVKRDEIRRCRRSKRDRPSSAAHRSMATEGDSIYGTAVNPDYQDRPLCGASIGAYRDEEHLPPVSFGGVVLVDGQAYGMSVHHMLEGSDEEDHGEEDDVTKADDESETSTVRSFEDDPSFLESEDDETVRPASTIPDISDQPDSHQGDCPGIVPGDVEEIVITQPALDDAIDMDLHVDEDEDEDEDSGIDEDHLLSYKLGQVHASSGLKRTPTSLEGGFRSISQSMPQEIDWALFELVPPRAHPYNIVRGGSKYCAAKSTRSADTIPIAIKSSTELPCAKVHCLGRTSGLGSGVISSTMELVKIHGRSTFSASWTVDGDFGVGGDSGAWVISNTDGKVCGHVVASRKGRTYICPMDLLLEDMKATLNASTVELPIPEAWREKLVSSSIPKVMGNLRLSEGGTGGVALPASPSRPSSSNRREFAAPAETIQAAG